MAKQDYSSTPQYHQGREKGATVARSWRIAKMTSLWKRGTRTEFRNDAIRGALRFRGISEDSDEGKAFSQGFTKAFNSAFMSTAGR